MEREEFFSGISKGLCTNLGHYKELAKTDAKRLVEDGQPLTEDMEDAVKEAVERAKAAGLH